MLALLYNAYVIPLRVCFTPYQTEESFNRRTSETDSKYLKILWESYSNGQKNGKEYLEVNFVTKGSNWEAKLKTIAKLEQKIVQKSKPM